MRVSKALFLRTILVAATLGFNASSQVMANPSIVGHSPLTESRALEAFRRRSIQLVAARFDLEATRADIIAAGVLPNPNVLLGAAVLAHGVPQSGKRELGVAVEQVIPLAGQVGMRRRAAQRFADAAEREFAAIAWALACNVRESFADLQLAQAKRSIVAAGLADLFRVEKIVTDRAGAGANAEYDRLRVQVERQNLAGRLSELDAELAQARVALAQAIGPHLDPASLVVREEIPDAPDAPTNVESLVARAKQRRPDLQAARLRVEAANARISQIRREYVPSPSVQVGYGYWTGVPVDAGTSSGGGIMVGVGVPLPLFDSGQGRVDRAAAERRAHEARVQASDLLVERETVAAAQILQARVAAWRVFRDSTASNIDRMRAIADLAYQQGRTGIMDLLDSYRAHLEARERSIALRAAAWRAALVLERAVGPASE